MVQLNKTLWNCWKFRKKIVIRSAHSAKTNEVKVQLLREGHKNLRNLPHGFDIYLVNVKTNKKIAQIFVAFSEKLNFNPRSIYPIYTIAISAFTIFHHLMHNLC